MRHDDLKNTPLHLCEWTRWPGSTKVSGFRSKAPISKTGVRIWVASIFGVSGDSSGDEWLPNLMELVFKAHGET